MLHALRFMLHWSIKDKTTSPWTKYDLKKFSDKRHRASIFAKLTQRKYKWHRATFLFVMKKVFSLAYFFDQISTWSTSKSKNQLRIRKRILSQWKLVGCSIIFHKLEIPGNVSTICKTFLNPYHLFLLWWRSFYPKFLFFEFL